MLDILKRFTGMALLKIRANQRFEIGPFGVAGRIYVMMGVAQHFHFSVAESSFNPLRSSVGMIHAEHSFTPAAATRKMISSLSARERRPSLDRRCDLPSVASR